MQHFKSLNISNQSENQSYQKSIFRQTRDLLTSSLTHLGMDKPSYRDARTHLKMPFDPFYTPQKPLLRLDLKIFFFLLSKNVPKGAATVDTTLYGQIMGGCMRKNASFIPKTSFFRFLGGRISLIFRFQGCMGAKRYTLTGAHKKMALFGVF